MTILEFARVQYVEGVVYNRVISAIIYSDKIKVTEHVRNTVFINIVENIRHHVERVCYGEREQSMKKLLDAYRIIGSL